MTSSNSFATHPQPAAAANQPQQWFTQQAQRQHQAHTITAQVQQVVQFYQCNPHAVLAYMAKQGTPVYVLRAGVVAASAIVQKLGFQPGYVVATPDWRYIMLRNGLHGLQGDGLLPGATAASGLGMVVLPEKMVSIGFVAYCLYHVLAHRQGMPGYEPEAIRLFQQNWEQTAGDLPQDVGELPELSIKLLQSAIHRETEALMCIRELQTLVLAPMAQSVALKHGQASA
jgi:hypothetical protein